MRVGLNATCLSDRPSGARQRFVGLYGSLIRRTPDVEYVVFEPEDCSIVNWFNHATNLTAIRTPFRSDRRVHKFLRGINYWPHVLGKLGLNIFECFNQPAIVAPSCPTLITIHDLRDLHESFMSPQRHLLRIAINHALKANCHIITVSRTMKAEIIRSFPNAVVTVIPNAISGDMASALGAVDVPDVPPTYTSSAKTILAVGHLEPRKNYEKLIEAIKYVRQEGHDVRLKIVGNESGSRKSIMQSVISNGLDDNVQLMSNLNDESVISEYRKCDLFTFVSCYEGFGIPILEAMAAGKTMVLSDIEVFKEIAGERAIYCNQQDPRDIARAISAGLKVSKLSQDAATYMRSGIDPYNYDALADELASLHRSLTK